VNDVVLVEVVDCIEHLSDRLGGVLFCELALFANAIEELSASRQLGHDIVLVLAGVSVTSPRKIAVSRIPSTQTNRET
jgi:hypothetical protein